jgi:predicted DNA-binding transcriptional regulator AlpA
LPGEHEHLIAYSEAVLHGPLASSSQLSKSRIIGLTEVMERTSYSKSKIYRDMRAGKFPPQAKKLEGSTSSGWFEDAIDEFIEARRPESSLRQSQPIPKVVQLGDTAIPDIHHPGRAEHNTTVVLKPQARRIAKDQMLMRTGMKLNGAEVYCHVPTRKLLVVVGSMSDECAL